MSPPDGKPSDSNSSPATVSSHGPKAKIRKRVRNACDRCRIKKTKCDGSTPCLRCQTDNIICCAKQPHRLKHRKFPLGYAEMLERQQGQLVSCIQQLYQRLRTAALWEQPLPENSGGKPLTHDILAALDLLGAKDDGSGELESFHNVARSPQSDDDITPSLFDGDTDVRNRHDMARSSQSDNDTTPSVLDGDIDTRDRHDSMMEQSKSPAPISKYAVFPVPGLAGLENHSKASTGSLSLPDVILELSPEYPRQSATQTSVMQSTSPQICAEHIGPQPQPLANSVAVPIHRSAYNSPSAFNRNAQSQSSQTHAEQNASASDCNTATMPSLSWETTAIRQAYSSDWITAGTSNHFPIWHAWARSGIMVDISDFSSDFHTLSPLEPSRYYGHFPGMLS